MHTRTRKSSRAVPPQMPRRSADATAPRTSVATTDLGMIESALLQLDGALDRLRGMTDDVQRVADKHLGSIPEATGGAANSAIPIAGTVHRLGNLSLDLSLALERHGEQLGRLSAL